MIKGSKKNGSYVQRRDVLIPEAMAMADKRLSKIKSPVRVRVGRDKQEYNHCMWTEFFHAAMGELARQEAEFLYGR